MRERVIRGEHLLRAIEEDSTYPTLRTNIQRAFPDTRKRQHATGEVQIVRKEFVPIQGSHALQVNSQSRSNDGATYQQTVQFTGVNYEPADTPENVTFMGADGADHHVQPITLQQSNVRVRCNCLDFHYRFALWNFNDGSLMGPKPAPYVRKTTTRPPANPLQLPGVCKHIIKLAQDLMGTGLIR